MSATKKAAGPVKSERVQTRVKSHPGWEYDEKRNAIVRSYRFSSFAAAIRFVDYVAQLADDADHHPDIDVRYDRVTLALSTHSAGGVTDKDFELAGRIDLR